MHKCLIGMAILFALAFTGCGSKDIGGDLSNLNQYGNVQPQKIQFKGVTWGILDKPEEERMLVVPLGDAPFEQYDGAAREFFERSKRECTVTRKRLASSTDFSFEFFYSCKK